MKSNPHAELADDLTHSARLIGYRTLLARLHAGEPVRILVGADVTMAMECLPHENWLAGCRAALIAEAERQIAALEQPSPPNEGESS